MGIEIIAVTVLIGLIFVLGFFALRSQKESGGEVGGGGRNNAVSGDDKNDNFEKNGNRANTQPTKKKTQTSKKSSKTVFSHPWLIGNLKGHSASIRDISFSENGKFLATCADDRTVLLWTVKDFGHKKENRIIRSNVAFDFATLIEWSPDSKAFVVLKATQNVPEVYKLGKKDDGSVGNIQPVVTFPKQHETDVVGLGFASTGKYIMTCSDKTDLAIWGIKGDLLATANNCHMTTYCAKVSPDGRYVATSGFTPDVKIWEVKFRKGSGEFDKLQRAFELKGHTSGIFHFVFSPDSSRIATISKDGTWKLFDIDIDFARGEEARVLTSGTFEGATQDSKIALSPDGNVLLISQGSKVTFFDAATGLTVGEIEELFDQEITGLAFQKDDSWFAVCGERYVRILRNVPGLKLKLADLKTKVQSASGGGLIERLNQQIRETEDLLEKSEEK